MRRGRSIASAEKFRGCEHPKARPIRPKEVRRNRHLVQPRQVVHPTKVTRRVRGLLTVRRLVTNHLNQPTSPDRSSFHKSLSAQAHHPSLALQETTKQLHSLDYGFGNPESARH